jgi:hypothetical protein
MKQNCHVFVKALSPKYKNLNQIGDHTSFHQRGRSKAKINYFCKYKKRSDFPHKKSKMKKETHRFIVLGNEAAVVY